MLDVGCGSGDLAVNLAESGIETLGIDFVEDAINQARAMKIALAPEVAGRLDFRGCPSAFLLQQASVQSSIPGSTICSTTANVIDT